MYGLASRESLSKRQSRWVRDVRSSGRGTPSRRTPNQEPPSNQVGDKNDSTSLPTPPLFDLHESSASSRSSLASNRSTFLRGTRDNPYNTSRGDIHNRSASSPNSLDSTDRSPLEQLFNTQEPVIYPENLRELISDLKRDNDNLKSKYSKLKREYGYIKDIVDIESDLSSRVDQMDQQVHDLASKHQDVVARISRLERNAELSSLILPMDSLEQYPLLHATDIPDSSSNTPELSSILDHIKTPQESSTDNPREFIPFFIKEDYSGRDNKTTLSGTSMKMVVDIVGLFDETPVIYPFGHTMHIPRFSESTLNMTFRGTELQDKCIEGTISGVFSRGPDNIYSIKITELYIDGKASSIGDLILPLTIICDSELVPE